MRQNNKDRMNFVTSFKYWIILPIVIAVVAIVLGAIFGLNLDYDFRNVDTFNVKFNTTITTAEYEVFEDEIAEIIEKNDVCDYRLERIGEGAENGILVKIASSEDIAIDDIKTEIEDSLETSAGDKITSAVIISITDTVINLPRNVLSITLYTLLAVGLIMLAMFIYTWIRYNLVAGYSSVLAILFEIAMLFGMQVVTRIPFNTNFLIAYVVMIISTAVLITIINNHIKATLNDEKYAKSSNAERVILAVKANYKGVVIASASAIVALMIVGFMGSVSTLYTTLSIILGLVISILTTLFFFTTIWSLGYKKDKDKMLKRRIELEKKRLEEKDKKNKTDEKIVV